MCPTKMSINLSKTDVTFFFRVHLRYESSHSLYAIDKTSCRRASFSQNWTMPVSVFHPLPLTEVSKARDQNAWAGCVLSKTAKVTYLLMPVHSEN